MPSHEELLARIEPALDRFREAHFWIHGLEDYYHYSDPLRWHLNAYLKSLKEVPLLIQMALQNQTGFSKWFSARRDQLNTDPLIRHLGAQRDIIVHRGMLIPNSHGGLGVTEGRGFKLGLSFPLDPMEDSDHAMHRYLYYMRRPDALDFLGILADDDDSLPCVHRVWKLEPFDQELVDLAATALLRLGELVNTVVEWIGAERQPLFLDCRHSGQRVQFKLYSRDNLRAQLEDMRRIEQSK
ncbi:MAG: hypothetical protein QM702_26225 [Rubrivivax sp.]